MALREDQQEQLSVGLLRKGNILFGEFTMQSGAKTPVYFDLRSLASFDHRNDRISVADQRIVRNLAVQGYSELLDQIQAERGYQHLLAIPEGTFTLAGLIGQFRGDSVLQERVKAKEHGVRDKMQGIWYPGERVVSIDDVVSTSLSKEKARDRYTGLGLIAEDFPVLVDRELNDPMSAMLAKGMYGHAVMKFSAVIDYWHAAGEIGNGTHEQLATYIQTGEYVPLSPSN